MKSPIIKNKVSPSTDGQLETSVGITANNQEFDPSIPKIAELKYSVGGGVWLWRQQPLHETITIAALIASDMNLDSKTTYDKAIEEHQYDTLEFLRGVLWNDDPANLLFYNIDDNNFRQGTGRDWYRCYLDSRFPFVECTINGIIGQRNIIARSHFGDLQFLHCMADNAGETPQETQKKVLIWLEIMYKVAIGHISIDTKLRDVQLPGNNDQDRYPLRRLFNNDTIPSDTDTIHTLMTSNHVYRNTKNDRRALGSCLHVIQDSFTRGHCYRAHLPNLKPKRYGDILTYHTYSGQDSHAHEIYDYNKVPIKDINCANIDGFKDLDGTTDAIYACTKLINYWMNNTPWEGAVQAWLAHDLFRISPDATPSNMNVESDLQYSLSSRL